jgi:SSS family solute:Na+ symporter
MPEKFDMILSPDNPSYSNLPGIWILIGAGVWIGHFAYWGFNQYITQRALGAKSIKEAQKGVMFAAYLKLLMPLVIVLPGICAANMTPFWASSYFWGLSCFIYCAHQNRKWIYW